MGCVRINAGRWLVVVACVAALAGMGCKEERPKRRPISEDFEIGMYPSKQVLVGNTMKVRLDYDACEELAFKLRYRIEDGTAHVWLRRPRSPCDRDCECGMEYCERHILPEAAFELPAEVLLQRSIVLHAPGPNMPNRYVLR